MDLLLIMFLGFSLCSVFTLFVVAKGHNTGVVEEKVAAKVEELIRSTAQDADRVDMHGRAHILVMDLADTLEERDALERGTQMKSIYTRAKSYKRSAKVNNVVQFSDESSAAPVLKSIK
ncbi:hypothetical protein [Pseudoalteromonas aurantia]|uniref:Uncharacterized protein n=1 Tax=Pseudoalteromonas aurantia TaxID=43654 RepID=A0A5S3VD46_9GAMM|nr:hypothetical protein [Pseudoalteromonas aurantia]TMO69946.1 hypothetical protein CWC19_02835 [Pseudoalteromonas aurantia]